jgi:hypothetical protein
MTLAQKAYLCFQVVRVANLQQELSFSGRVRTRSQVDVSDMSRHADPPTAQQTEKPFNKGFLKVSEIHTIAFAEYGNPKGLPALVVHGGPGAGCFSRHTCASEKQELPHWPVIMSTSRVLHV